MYHIPSQNHVTCVSEHEKYALGATKPGGFAEKGFYHDGAAPAASKQQGGPVGMEHLTTRYVEEVLEHVF